MENIHQNYVDIFIQSGTKKLREHGYLIRPDIVDGLDGVTSINLINQKCPELNKVVRFAYNRLDYNLGVIVYGAPNGKLDSNQMLLPKTINTDSDTYSYMGENLSFEVERLINDICNKLIKTSNSK